MPGRPIASPTTAPGLIRLGPATAPAVTAQTTMARERPRCSGSARSTAANLAWRFAAVASPSRAAPARSRANNPDTVAAIIRIAPSIPHSTPDTSPTLRPRRSARPASGMAATAAARVVIVVTDPAQALEPESWTARREPTDRLAPLPTPLSSWARLRIRTVRRWTR
jgi:hypothetical protein